MGIDYSSPQQLIDNSEGSIQSVDHTAFEYDIFYRPVGLFASGYIDSCLEGR
jgi:hypothetical protein